MLFEELVIRNFGIYKGSHTVDLRPKDINKPIILFGALNGSGKTTLLDALQLVLYGKFANCSNKGSLSYTEYLRETINSNVDASEGVALELQFLFLRDGMEERYRVFRKWRSTGKGIKEELEVHHNGKLDPVVTERWYEYVEEFIPSKISSLFFFDGEKIESLADKERSSDILKTGVHALLGLDLVEQLGKDLTVLESRRKSELATVDDNKALKELEKRIDELVRKREHLTEKMASQRSRLDQLERKEIEVRTEFRVAGGELLQKREMLEAEQKSLKNNLLHAENVLRDLAEGVAPLILVKNLIHKAERQSKIEEKSRLNKEMLDEIKVRDKEIVSLIDELFVDESAKDKVKSFLIRNVDERAASIDVGQYIKVQSNVFQPFSNSEINRQQKTISKYLEQVDRVTESLTVVTRKIASIPDSDSISGISEKLENILKQINETRIQLEAIGIEYERISSDVDAKKAERLRHLERITSKGFVDRSHERVLSHSNKIRETLALFKRSIAQQHISKLESLILDSFKQLIRKESLIEHVSIDLKTYVLTLHRSNGDVLPTERLSAGERQLLAVSILWGLAKASGRPLPTIIDTPLGRLDGEHRSNLIKAYFPYASHQVILLSTDEEIDKKYHKLLKPYIGSEFVIEYNNNAETSQVNNGYFW
ncbi:MAG: DNA sulfur modification protein DndD [Gammaproteobacteria bacterium]|nr:DNA sulfur modification protein DndD [Gammaproteobacteria bacterium]MCW8839755.1 DNA sulfur modification protein DndD [Gammaproteobacteria bacterium]MCW8959277.1 DNA sulfur modification protein DndD [Gammaproteobacteria bacterium]MCW8992432.1 DNA sulfur modification protein DndD [Gammaproteobacteria bacterium]